MDTDFQAPPEWGLYSAPDPLSTPAVAMNSWADTMPTSPSKEDLLGGGYYGLFDDSRIGLTSPYLAQSPRASPLRRAKSSEAVFVGQPHSPFYTTSGIQHASSLRSGITSANVLNAGSPSSPTSEETVPTPQDGQPPSAWVRSSAASTAGKPTRTVRARRSSQQLKPSVDVAQTQRPSAAARSRRRSSTANGSLGGAARAGIISGPSGVVFGSPGDLGITIAGPESAPMGQQPSIEDVNQFMNDMSEMLGPEALAAISPEVKPAAVPAPTYPRAADPPTGQTYNVNGVILDAEDYALYSQSPTLQYHAQWAQQPFAVEDDRQRSPPTFSHGHAPVAGRRPSYAVPPPEHYVAGQALAHPPFERPRSAPASPDVGSVMGGGGFAPYPGSYQAPAFRPIAIQNSFHRRGSSVDHVPRSFPEMVPMGAAPPHVHHSLPRSQGYPMPQPPPHYHHMAAQAEEQRTPPQYHRLPHGYPTPTYTNPSPTRAYNSSSPTGPTPPPARVPLPGGGPRRMSSQPSLVKPSRPTTPSRKSTSGAANGRGGRRSKDGGFSFINFTASDSKKLLSGVAPSGSSKRKREEEAAAAAERAAKRKAAAESNGSSAEPEAATAAA
ncbi:hypothetical protein OIO90_000722 [Microbotryomycetes sp. JL221]|nr:hypothetical protein OIO90_000722 [Microbotryomycetes sp. JL221]